MARRGEHPTQNRRHPFRFLVNLLFAEAQDLESARPQVEIAATIVPESLAAPVVSIAIGLEREPALSPQEIDEVGTDANVDLGQGQTGTAAEPQKISL
jgi:hypothetical protein